MLTAASVSMPAWPAVAWAQDAPPQPTLSRTASPVLGYGIMVVLVVLVLGVSLLPAKRGHQD